MNLNGSLGRRASIVFVLDQLQDVNIARGLIYLAGREFDTEIVLLANQRFFARDRGSVWGGEISALMADTGATITTFIGPDGLERAYRGRHGIVIAPAESDLSPHRAAHMALRLAPASFVRVTLQHGHECPGFLQNRDQVIAHGENVTFAADVVCAWGPPSGLTSLVASERSKVLVTGPSTLLNRPASDPRHPPVAGGIVCENLHSARLTASGDHGAYFVSAFETFAAALQQERRGVTLRPHPGGQYFMRNRMSVPENVTLNSLPIYHVDLSQYAYGLSAPSTMIVDMALADIPVAVWRDPAGVMDVTGYAGLSLIGKAEDWLAFARDARFHREALLAVQHAWLDSLGIVRNRSEVYRRFARLIAAALSCTDTHQPQPSGKHMRCGAGQPGKKRAKPNAGAFLQ